MNGADPYVYPGTYVLKNKLGIEDAGELERVESLFFSVRQKNLPDNIPLTAEGYKALHKHLFQDVYDFAGEFRTVNVSKFITENKSVTFELAPLVAVNMRRYFGELNADNCLRGLDADTFAYRAAVYMDDLNYIHPFREGNGRAQRVFLKSLASQAGHNIDLERITRKDWINGAVKSREGDFGPMTDCIRAACVEREKEKTRSGNNAPQQKPDIQRALDKVKKIEEQRHNRGDKDRER